MLKTRTSRLKKTHGKTAQSSVRSNRVRHWKKCVLEHFSRIRGVDAVFAYEGDDGTSVVYTLVSEHESRFYKPILRAEQSVQKEYPERVFDFKIWAHQGRDPYSVIPFQSPALFIR